MNKTLLQVLVLLSSVQLSQGEELYRFPSGPATWTITCESKGGTTPGAKPEASEPAKLERIEIAQSSDARRSVMRWTNGQSRELWSLPQMSVIVTEDPAGTAIVSRNTELFGDAFGPPDFGWIKPSLRTSEKPVAYGELQCYHYKGILEVPTLDEPGATEKVPCEAWIDAKTQLPVALRKGDTLGRFSFGELTSPLQMPEKFRRRLDQYKLVMGMQ